MKQINPFISICGLCLLGLSSCMDNYDDPDVDDYLVTSSESIGETNYTIAELKSEYSSLFSQTNSFQKVTEDIILEGVVVANDEGGNLYQTLLLRDIDTSREESDVLRDQAIVLAVKHTWLTPYFPVGQRIKVNLNGLYIGVYSKLPKIGQPYYTSSGNLRLGPILLQYCATNIELVGEPDASVAECEPLVLSDNWLGTSSYKNYLYYPQLVTVTGTIAEADGEAIFAPEEEQDAGYGVDRTLNTSSGNTSLTIRTSTQNAVSFTIMPTGVHNYTGLLSYYSEWQVQLRGVDDID